MSKFKKGSIVDVKPVMSSKFRGCILNAIDVDYPEYTHCRISNLNDGSVDFYHEYEIDPNVVISDINDFAGDS
mgnify:CR=1 FL=1|jgi:hypothetical protein